MARSKTSSCSIFIHATASRACRNVLQRPVQTRSRRVQTGGVVSETIFTQIECVCVCVCVRERVRTNNVRVQTDTRRFRFSEYSESGFYYFRYTTTSFSSLYAMLLTHSTKLFGHLMHRDDCANPTPWSWCTDLIVARDRVPRVFVYITPGVFARERLTSSTLHSLANVIRHPPSARRAVQRACV